MVPVSYHDFFSGCATISGALIGLLFVAISVAPEKLAGDRASVDHQLRAGAAFSALINTLVISLVALLPGSGLGAASTALSASGLATTAALILVLWREHKGRIRLGQVIMLIALIVLYGLQLANAIQLNGSPGDRNAVDNQSVLAIVFFLFAIARAWQIVGARDTSLLSTVTGMAYRQPSHDAHLAEQDQTPETGPASNQDDTG